MRTGADHRLRQRLVLVLWLAIAGVAWIYRPSFLAMVGKWLDDAAFTYGFVVAPISLWLVVQKRPSLAAVPFAPSWLGAAAGLALAMLWIVARGTGVLVLEQVAAVGMIPALVLGVLGPKAAQVLRFPLALLFFMVPFGRAIVPWLMQATADVATLALQWSGIPVFRSHMYITIPGGSFEVARACSGIAFLMTALVLGVVYAHMNYAGWRKRALCVLAAVGVPILANGIRVYLTIAVAHLTDMRFGPGAEHLTFAQVFFVLVLLGMFWLGKRWQDERPTSPQPDAAAVAAPVNAMSLRAWLPVPTALLAMLLAPAYHAHAMAGFLARVADAAAAVRLPRGVQAWHGPVVDGDGWRPLYRGGITESRGAYLAGDGARVDVFVAVYALGATAGAEMISFGNVLTASEHASLADVRRRRLDVGDGQRLTVRELVVSDAAGEFLVWHWYVLGDRPAASPFVVKALEAVAWVTQGEVTERVVTLATPTGPEAHDRLEAFVRADPRCIASGFTAKVCGG